MQRPPKKYIVQIDNFRLAEFLFYWMYYDQPCSLLFQKPRTEGLTAVKLIVDNDEACSEQRKRQDANYTPQINESNDLLGF